MPRLTIHISSAQLAELTALNRAIAHRRIERDPQADAMPVEATAAVAVEYGLQELRRVWVATEVGVKVRNGEILGEHVEAGHALAR